MPARERSQLLQKKNTKHKKENTMKKIKNHRWKRCPNIVTRMSISSIEEVVDDVVRGWRSLVVVRISELKVSINRCHK